MKVRKTNMREINIIDWLIYWTRRLLSSEGRMHTVKSWQIIEYLTELEKRGV
jgi:hypothetical protein